MNNLTSILTPDEIAQLRRKVQDAIHPLQPARERFDPYCSGQRTRSGRKLQPYYLVYFLLVELLQFRNSGKGEKVAWSVPVVLNGTLMFIEHRKFGLGVFPLNVSKRNEPFREPTEQDESIAEMIVELVSRGIAVAEPFFAHLAATAVKASELNVANNSRWLFDRYSFTRDQFRKKLEEAEASKAEAEARKKEKVVTEKKGQTRSLLDPSVIFLEYRLREQAEWLGLAAIEAFFLGRSMSSFTSR